MKLITTLFVLAIVLALFSVVTSFGQGLTGASVRELDVPAVFSLLSMLVVVVILIIFLIGMRKSKS